MMRCNQNLTSQETTNTTAEARAHIHCSVGAAWNQYVRVFEHTTTILLAALCIRTIVTISREGDSHQACSSAGDRVFCDPSRETAPASRSIWASFWSSALSARALRIQKGKGGELELRTQPTMNAAHRASSLHILSVFEAVHGSLLM